jgi:hypothetical protein
MHCIYLPYSWEIVLERSSCGGVCRLNRLYCLFVRTSSAIAVWLLFDSEKYTTRNINSHNSHSTLSQIGDYESGSLFELMSRVVCSVSNKSEITICPSFFITMSQHSLLPMMHYSCLYSFLSIIITYILIIWLDHPHSTSWIVSSNCFHTNVIISWGR